MRLLGWVTFLTVLLPLSVVAQDFPKIEIFGGYSYFRMPSKLSANYEYTTEPAELSGWNFTLTGNQNRWVGLEADFGGYYGDANALYWHSSTSAIYRQDFAAHTFLFGPRLSFRNKSIVTPFIHILVGGVFLRSLSMADKTSSSSVALGGGCDFRVARRFAIRAIQADYVRSSLFIRKEKNLRLSTGVVVRF